MAKKGSNKQANIILGLNMTQFQKGLRTAQARLKRFGKTMSRFGSSMTRSVTLPLLGAGIAGIKLASDLEKSFAKIENLVGVTGPVLEGFKEKLKEISTETAISQRALADALFVITSAGVRGAEAMDILSASSKSSQVGMGETEDIARGITGAMNSYAKSNLRAGRAADIMMAIVREGNLVASDLAPTLGRVTGMAAELGISFEELGANIATFTRLGVPTEEAVTGLRGVMSAILKPTKAAKDVMDSIGMSSSDLRKRVGKEGLHSTLMFLVDALKGNEEGLSSLFGNVRALSNVLGTAGAQGESYKVILDSITKSTGMVDKAFENVSKTSAFKFDEAIVALKNNAIELGVVMLPMFVKIVDGITNMVKGFRDMDPILQKTIMIVGVLVAAMGPLAYIIGSTSTVIAAGIKLVGASLVGAGPIIAATTLVVTGLMAAMALIKGSFMASNRAMSANEKSIRSNHSEAKLLLKTIESENISQDTRNKLIEKFNKNFSEYGGNLNSEEGALSNILAVKKKLNAAFSDSLKDTIIEEKKTKIFDEQLNNQKLLQASQEKNTAQTLRYAAAHEELTRLLEERPDATFLQNTERRAKEDAIRQIKIEIENQKTYSAAIAAATIETEKLNAAKSDFKTPEEIKKEETDAKEASAALKAEQDKIDEKARIVHQGEVNAAAAKAAADKNAIEAKEIQSEAELSIMGDKQREIAERTARHTKELAVLEKAGYTDRVAFEEEFNKDIAEIQERYLAESLSRLDRESKAYIGNNNLLAGSLDMLREKSVDLADAYNNVLRNSMQEVVSGLSSIAGAMIMGQADSKDFGVFLLGSFANLLDGLGQIALNVAVGVLAIGETLRNLDPGPAAVAAVALFAMAGIARAQMKTLGDDIPALAEGGLAFGPTLAMVGDNRNASVDPEVVAPLSKLKDMMGDGNGQNITVTGRLSGSDLLISNERAGRQRSRYRGF